MKTTIKTISLALLLSISSLLTAQDYIKFTYDNAGNRVYRERVLVISKTVEANIEKEKDKVVLVYPNPTKGEFKIEIELEEKEIATAEIYDNQARKLKSIDISNNTTPVDISEYANGVYFLKVYCIKENEEAETHEWKIVKQQ